MLSTGQPSKRDIDWRRVRRFLWFTGMILIFSAGLIAVYYSLMLPILLSLLLSYLLLPLVEFLARKGIARTLAIGVIVLGSVTGLVIAGFKLVPLLYAQMLILIDLMPNALQSIVSHWLPIIEESIERFGVGANISANEIVQSFNIFNNIQAHLQGGLQSLWMTGTALLGGAVNILLIPLVTFYVLKEFPNAREGAKGFIPVDLLQPTKMLIHTIDQTLRSVIKGQVTVASILVVLYVIGLSTVGLQSAIAIGVVAGICRVVPYLDVIVGSILSMIVILSNFQGWTQVLGVFIVFIVVQTIDGAFITPRVIGERVGLHPVIVILSVLAMGFWFGFWGVLIAIPVIAILKALMTTALPYYHKSHLFLPEWFNASTNTPLSKKHTRNSSLTSQQMEKFSEKHPVSSSRLEQRRRRRKQINNRRKFR